MDIKLIQNLLTILNQIKYYHWQTTSFARHKALDKAHDDLSDLIDSFVEILIAKHGRDFLQTMEIKIHSKQDVNMENALNEMVQFFNQLNTGLNAETDTDLLNIRDEMLGVINRTKYLFTLK